MPQLAIPVAAETAVAGTMTAAEIAAAEAAAQAAAEAAAAEAATQAAAQAAAEQAAQQAATQAASEAAAQQTAQQAAQQASTNGIQTLAQEVGVNSNPTGIEQVFQQAQANNVPMSQTEFLNNSFAGPASPVSTPITPTTLPPVTSQLPPFDATQYLNSTVPGSIPTAPPVPAAPPAPPAAPVVEAPAAAQPPVDTRFPTQVAGQPEAAPSAMNQVEKPYEWTPQTTAPNAAPGSGGLESLLNQGVEYAKKNPLSTGLGAMSAYNYLNKPKPYEKPKYKSTFNAGAYSGYEPPTPNYYRAQYAHGGLADLGSYSDGGRMLKGPGDGMSDDIPATIANKQPARLANEEFVIPADVVSHLGNGSSEAGAKQLYKMMDRVRQARTGTKKQGKQIKPEKYLA